MTEPLVSVACADSSEYLRGLPEARFHACVTDPPYGLGDPPDPADVLQQWATAGDWSPRKGRGGGGFMGAAWDRFVPGPAAWREVLRVLRPGAYCAVFAGTRTWDWMSLSLRFAGFEVCDTIMWVYGSGFPKGGDVSKRIDAMLGAGRATRLGRFASRKPNGSAGVSSVGLSATPGHTESDPVTPEAVAWEDCSTTLKPAWEPIILAQRPYRGSAAACCVEHGAGALQVGACRIPASESTRRSNVADMGYMGGLAAAGIGYETGSDAGRWPANVVLDEEAAALLDAQSGPKGGGFGVRGGNRRSDYRMSAQNLAVGFGDSGGPSRFFYCAKASAADRDEGLPEGERNRHPTVKPVALMRWLSRLVTPPGGELLDPFAGSGSTGKAAALEGLRALLIERDPAFAEVARRRCAAVSLAA